MCETGDRYHSHSDEVCEYPLLEKIHFHVALEEVRVTELLMQLLSLVDTVNPPY